MQNLGEIEIDSAKYYENSRIYRAIHNTILPILRRSGLNITACDLVSASVYNDILAKTGKTSRDIAGGESFWLSENFSGDGYCVYEDGRINYDYGAVQYSKGRYRGARPLITVVR